ncbi:hypothetical protein MalM25_30240 [Planctomycetes bacterium MalM25]|nr:hypothetical protein MalM25_30240 [Planctomycetes bacterium MalM25]
MPAKLTAEQLSEIAAHPGEPIPLIDEAGDTGFYIIPATQLTGLEAAARRESGATAERLRAMIDEADRAPDLEADEFRRRVEAMVDQRRSS